MWRYFRQPNLAPRLWQFLSFSLSFSLFIGGFALFAERRLTWNGKPFGPEQVGYMWAYAGFLGIFLQGPALGKMVRRFGERSLSRVGFASYAAGYVIMALSHSVGMLMAATTVSALGSLVRPTLTSEITQATPRDEQGVVLGLTQSLTSVGQIFGPLFAGFLIGHGVLTGWGLFAAVVAATGLVLASGFRRAAV